MLEVYASIPERLGVAEIADYAQRVEAMGYDGLHIPDAVHDALLMAALALNSTQSLKVGTSILVVFPRSPMNVAVAAWDLQALSNGRFELGIGSQVKANIEQRYSTEWTPPVPRMRHYIWALRAIFNSFQTGEPLQFESEHYTFTKLQKFFNPGPLPSGAPPVFMGGVGSLMTQLAGEVADGLLAHPTNSHPEYIKQITRPRLARGQKKSTQRQNLRFFSSTLLATGKTREEVDQMREERRQLLAFLYSTPAYWPALELFGWQELGEQLKLMAAQNQWHKMAALLSDDILDTLVVSAKYEDLAGIMCERYAGLCDAINLPVPVDRQHDPLMAEVIDKIKQYPG